MAQKSSVLGIDFGTSNSAAGVFDGNAPRLIEMLPGHTTLPTTFFFDFETRRTLIGEPANAALLDGAEGRFMRALKRVLGTSLMHEKRQVLNERVTFVDIIARFLRHLKDKAEAETGQRFDRALSGRPVVFHGIDDPREAQAEADLRACYLAAGFDHVEFLLEPEAAAIASGAASLAGQVGLIVDIGGGTSDFSLFHAGTAGVEILANHGIRIGGTDFDRAISIDRVMPLLGRGTRLRKIMGDGFTPVPISMFNDLATWEQIPFLYTVANKRLAAEMLQLAEEPDKLSRLATVLEDQLGHDIAFAVEHGKIAANGDQADAVIDLGVIERHLRAPLSAQVMDSSLADHGARLSQAVTDTLDLAGVTATAVNHVIYVGGSSLMSVVPRAVDRVLPHAEANYNNVFTAVADGLAIAAGRTAV